ncbi:glycosyltransferase [Acetobacter musti]|uniref:Glycosyltransferase n=1 Tax=Acetobacter musti TaxID=864732 RepID=A0ABX0JTN4_9PROT|nr:glycosyltransferase family 4 protein [Acetobacter musti]NHN86179.1 glycosyltransferase [Acetobacter musti]
MRIAYVINSLEGGGAAAGLKPVAAFLRNAGHSITLLVLTPRDRLAEAWFRNEGFDIRTRDGGEKDHIAASTWLTREVAALRPTHIWTSLTRATLLGQITGRQLKIPVVSWQHNAWLKWDNLILLKRMRHLSCHWIADSTFVADLTRRRLSLPESRVSTWPIFSAAPDVKPARPWRYGETIRIGSLGRLHPAKGYDILCAALRLLPLKDMPPFRISIGGQGKEENRLQEMIREYGLDCLSLNGFTSDTETFLAGQHLYLQPSRREGFCIAAHEAMQAGLGVIASSVGELSHSVKDDVTGWTVPPENPQALADTLFKVLLHPERLGDVGTRARSHVLSLFGPDRFEAAGHKIISRLPGDTATSAQPRTDQSALIPDAA